MLLIERKVIKKFGPLRWSNHWLGASLGVLKGVVYATLILWAVEAGTLWKLPPEQEPPGWLEESGAVGLIGPWNPIRMFTLREVTDQMRLRAAKGEKLGGRSKRDETLSHAPPVRELINEIENDEDWAHQRYGELLTNPKVQKIIRDPDLRVLLFGL